MTPFIALPFALEIDGWLGGMRALGREGTAETPAPFDGAIGVLRMRVGVNFQLR